MPNTYIAIASVTVGSGGASTIDFTSIPSTYTDLQLVSSLRQTIAGEWENTTIDFNGSTANQQMRNLCTTNGSSASTLSFSRFYNWINASTSTASTFSNSSFYIPNYADSNNKTVSIDSVTENNGTIAFLGLSAFLWSNTAAINRVTITPNGGTFVQYSTATLYGIKNS